jgi:predicted amidophosphoribosyltransferase
MNGETRTVLMPSSRKYPGIGELFHAAFYHAPRMGYQDVISRTVLEFKQGCEPQTSRWVKLVAPAAASTMDFDVIVRALHHDESGAGSTSALDRLCEAIGRKSGQPYEPHRLTKVREVRPLNSVGGRAAREAELEGVYLFDSTGLNEKAKVLVVDDYAATGVTLKMISTAIRTAREDLQVACLVLARADAEQRNGHLDADFFIAKAPEGTAKRIVRRESSGREDPKPRMVSVKHSDGAGEPGRSVTDAHAKLSREKTSRPRGRRTIPVWVYGAGLAFSVVVLGTTVLMPKGQDPVDASPQFVRLVAEESVTSPDPIPERHVEAPVTEQPAGRPAIITVPSTGIRSWHSLDAKPIPRINLKNKEKIFILHRFSSSTGPDWIQIRSQSGATGWVIASVVREVKG